MLLDMQSVKLAPVILLKTEINGKKKERKKGKFSLFLNSKVTLGTEPFVFQFAIQKFKDQDI